MLIENTPVNKITWHISRNGAIPEQLATVEENGHVVATRVRLDFLQHFNRIVSQVVVERQVVDF